MQTRLELYQLVAPLAGLGIWERNLITDDVYWNAIFRKILEVDDSYQPQPEASLKFYKKPELVRLMWDEVITTGQPQQAELELIAATGEHKWVKLRMQTRSEGRNVFLYGTLEDITEEVKLRNLLEEREQRFSQAFDHAPIGMALVSLQGEWLKVNASVCTLLGYTEQEFFNRTFQEITYPDDLEIDLKQMHQLIKGEEAKYSMEKRYIHKDGHIIWALLNVSVVRDDERTPLYFISQIKDITELKKSMEIINSQNQRLLNFAHIVSHNLRSHAGNIHMLTKMIINENDAEEKTTLTNMLTDNADNLLDTLTELNEIVKIHDNGVTRRQSINIWHEIERVTNILSASIKAADARMNIQIDKGLTIQFNPAYFESIFVNLISNSLKYKHPGRTPAITITATQSIDKVRLSVADNGLGLDMSLHGHKLFGMYKVFHGNEDARGIGLFLVKNQVEAMGGTITANSIPGEGMTFLIEFSKI
jgi:PAS domain S-box-containing protein